MYKRRRIFDPQSKEPYKISRSRIELFYQCPRCFYLQNRLGISRPSLPGFSLNSAVDALFKKEFDVYRAKAETHPLMKSYGIDAIPFQHLKINEWRNNFVGVRAYHKKTNFLVFGAIDDVWVTKDKKIIVVDYKSTSTSKKIDLNGKWKQAYKRQIEIYQWLMRQQKDLKENGYEISSKGYFVYANGRKDEKAFDGKLEFDIEIIPYIGDDSWVEPKIIEAHKCLMSEKIPEANEECEYCQYRRQAGEYRV